MLQRLVAGVVQIEIQESILSFPLQNVVAGFKYLVIQPTQSQHISTKSFCVHVQCFAFGLNICTI